MRIISPMAYGNGAHILHQILENHLPDYKVKGYSPYLTIIPLLLKAISIPKNIDLIHTTPDYAPFFASKKTPLLITFHGYSLEKKYQRYNSALQNIHYSTDLKLFTSLAIMQAHTITAVSQHTATTIRKNHNITKPIHIIHNGIDEKAFRPIPTNQIKNKINVLFSGNLRRQKGAHWLPEILKKTNANINLYATTGPMNLHRELKGIRSVGTLQHKDMPRLYNSMDILLMPTVREGFGLAVAEAMACGLPVVATNCTALPELIDHGKGGYLCNMGDTEDFAEKINILSESPKLRHEMGEYNRNKIESGFTLNRMITEYKNLFESILS